MSTNDPVFKTKPLTTSEYVDVLVKTIKDVQKGCMNCSHFDSFKDRDLCRKHNGKPPARIIVNGCNDYDHFPF